ncbi:uncharacterized protein K452DRAFT_53047 [Aplosporella prunicola CBS 121167]|uniref:Uncharacterized protein n=1 Tax=Aplosporella prunicola CBS 121167 TaxID=1176127 RepID=A0A6A6BAE4_9PEZI|nr:uncharacterized protein K452DRAFT_53047 [Aplosporella prunicola CBS 121167]KAF2140224.1 hypothetical protein K452DRAFT_53047 [Aplosporella prunicola CBS 121167]
MPPTACSTLHIALGPMVCGVSDVWRGARPKHLLVPRLQHHQVARWVGGGDCLCSCTLWALLIGRQHFFPSLHFLFNTPSLAFVTYCRRWYLVCIPERLFVDTTCHTRDNPTPHILPCFPVRIPSISMSNPRISFFPSDRRPLCS